MSTIPCRLGGKLTGHVETPLQEVPPQGVTLALKLRWMTPGAAAQSGEITELSIWSETDHVTADWMERGPGGFNVPVDFDIPADGRPTGERKSRNTRAQWCLIATARVPDVDYRTEFAPPVFRLNPEGRIDEDHPLAF